MRLFKKTTIALSLISFYSLAFTTHAYATDTYTKSSDSAFAELDQATKKANRSQDEINQEFIGYINQRLDEYEQWREDYTKDLDEQRQALINQWGSAEISDKATDVEYSSDNTVKKVIDYDNNTATVSVLVDSSVSEDQAKQQLTNTQLPDGATFDVSNAQVTEEAVDYSPQREDQEKSFIVAQTQQQMNEYDVQAERLIAANTGIPDDFIYQRAYGKKMALIDEAKKRMAVINKLYQSKREELGMVSVADSQASGLPQSSVAEQKPTTALLTEKPLTEKRPAKEKSTEALIQETPLETPAANATVAQTAPKKVISYKINLPNNSLAKRASEYQPMALQESDKWSVDPALVMAIMHSESAFRPDAKSHVPAFGLMQIVPSSAGRDVNKQVRNIDAPMAVADLYQPPVNVETGTAYLHILNSKYLKNIENDQSRLYCTIAAYNTGAGNVARAFNSNRSTNINTAAEKINDMTPEQVYTQLINNLPYDETKNYLKKVSSRMALYQAEKPKI
ncbi:MAG: transglycosylase SLT domain-containing protein [Vibrio sp.]|uniref:transglycosylase SLT domain-containing protein n=1 Tax=Vibrio sp. TaxID=678 RepID=UPI003A8425C2